jgi:hypothetical protein
MIGICYACGKSTSVQYEALCSEKCRAEYKEAIATLREAVHHPASLRACDKALKAVESLPLIPPGKVNDEYT